MVFFAPCMDDCVRLSRCAVAVCGITCAYILRVYVDMCTGILCIHTGIILSCGECAY